MANARKTPAGFDATLELDGMIEAALHRLMEIGPTWKQEEKEQWCALFIATVDHVYPSKRKRKSPTKRDRLHTSPTSVNE